MHSSLQSELERRARAAGFDLFGLVDAERFDGCRPQEQRCAGLLSRCGTAVVLGSGTPRAISPGALRELESYVAGAGIGVRTIDPQRSGLSLACLGEAAGFGIVSPVIHRLLHPQFGPWVTVHAALLLQGRPFGDVGDASITATFHPCCQCPRPCVAACPGGVHDGKGGSAPQRCHDQRQTSTCSCACAVVRACPLGREHAVPAALESHRHAIETAVISVQFGGGFLQSLRRRFWR